MSEDEEEEMGKRTGLMVECKVKEELLEWCCWTDVYIPVLVSDFRLSNC